LQARVITAKIKKTHHSQGLNTMKQSALTLLNLWPKVRESGLTASLLESPGSFTNYSELNLKEMELIVGGRSGVERGGSGDPNGYHEYMRTGYYDC
jgi:hypothetical protein